MKPGTYESQINGSRRIPRSLHGRDAEDFVVFLIGMRLNRPWKVHKWLPIFTAMPRMLRWLDQHPKALLKWHNAWINGPAVVQYWRSFEQLERFARWRARCAPATVPSAPA
jgi:hypothetical protein